MSGRLILIFSIVLILSGVLISAFVFAPYIREEYRYQTVTKRQSRDNVRLAAAEPLDREFGILIPKIGANARIVPDVDPYDSRIYQQALTEGVAHAKGTAYPGEDGTMFIFSHSSATIVDANRYNSVFYLLGKLEKGDPISIYFQGHEHLYTVSDTRIVSASETSYLTDSGEAHRLVLMACWPPGTTFRRLIIIAQPDDLE